MKYLLLAFVIIGALDCALGWYLDSRMVVTGHLPINGDDIPDRAAMRPRDLYIAKGQRRQPTVILPFVNPSNNGLFRNRGGWWQVVVNGHALPLLAPSWAHHSE